MTRYEYLHQHRADCEAMTINGIAAADVLFLDLYDDYQRMRREGHKYEWMMAWLADQYGMSQSTIYRTIKRLDEIVL